MNMKLCSAILFGFIVLFFVHIRAEEKQAKIAFNQRNGELIFNIEIADNEASRSQGLMYRKSLPESAGMLFIFPKLARHAFWMKNTLIPLDMIFLDANLVVVGIVANATPGSLNSRGVAKESLYVLELNAGSAEKFSIKEGSQARLINFGKRPE